MWAQTDPEALLLGRSGLGEGGGGDGAGDVVVDGGVVHGMLRPCQGRGPVVHTTRNSMVTAACDGGSSPRLYVRNKLGGLSNSPWVQWTQLFLT